MEDRLSDNPPAFGSLGLQELVSEWKASERLYNLEGSDAVNELLVESFSRIDAVNRGVQMRITVLSLNAFFNTQALLAQRIQLHTTLADGTRSTVSLVVAHFEGWNFDGGWARGDIIARDITHLLGQSSHNRLWQDKSVLDVIHDVLDAPGYQGLFSTTRYGEQDAQGNAENLDDFLANGPGGGRRGLITQHAETDLAFFSRLLASEGLNWRVEEDPAAPAGHRIVIFSDSRRCPQNPTSEKDGGIRFHRGDAAEEADTVQALAGHRTLNPTATAVLGWRYDAKRTVAAQAPTNHAFAGPNASGLANWLEHYVPFAQTGDTDASVTSDQLQHSATLIQEAFEARNKHWSGLSTARSARSGQYWAITQSVLDQEGRSPEDKQFLLVEVRSLGVNNLTKDLKDMLSEGLASAGQWHRRSFEEWPEYDELVSLYEDPQLLPRASAMGYANRFEAIRRHVPWRPLPPTEPTATGLQSAIVVGPTGNMVPEGADELYTDALGRVKLRFHWQSAHYADPRPDNTHCCWVRVARSWAGKDLGAQFVPRIGQEVLVDFLGGSIDRPVVVGAVYNGQGEGGVPVTPGGQPRTDDRSMFAQSADHQPSGQGNLMGSGTGGHSPAWHGAASGAAADGAPAQNNSAALSGIKTKEFGGEGYNQLVFDDTDNQLRVQLATTQHGTQLNMGHSIHQADNHRGSFRGLGFELRTDAYGALRAAQGVLLTTYCLRPGHPMSADPAGDNAPGMALFKQACTLADTLDRAALAHQTTRLAVSQGSTQAGQGVLSETEPPLKALHTAMSGMADSLDLNAALEDAERRNTAAANGKVPALADPVVAMVAKAGFTTVAGQDLQFASEDVIGLASGRDIHVASGEQLRLHTGQSIGVLAGAVQPGGEGAQTAHGKGLTLINGTGPIDVQAQAGQLEVAAKTLVNIKSAATHIDWAAANKITIQTEGGAQIVIDASGIHHICPGKITVHAATKSFVGPASHYAQLPILPKGTPGSFHRQVQLQWKGTEEPAKFQRYELHFENGRVIKGVADENGFTDKFESPALEPYTVYFMDI